MIANSGGLKFSWEAFVRRHKPDDSVDPGLYTLVARPKTLDLKP